MNLFDYEPLNNLLPYDGTVVNYGPILTPVKARHYFDQLMSTIAWRQDELFLFGKHMITKRKVAWYGARNFSYTYSNATKEALIWTDELKELKEKVESVSGGTFNSSLLNLYHSGEESMSWHSDDERELGKNTTIASLSLGAQRKFVFKHKKTQEKVSLILESGSLLVMKDETQSHWLHSLPKMKRVTRPRINITFRRIVG